MSMASYGLIFDNYGAEKVTSTSLIGGNPIGTVLVLPDGRKFRHAHANGAISAGNLCMEDDISNASHDTDLAVTATAIGSRTVNITNAGVGMTKDQFSGGFLYVNDEGADAAGQGMIYKVEGHPAATTTEAIDVRLEEPWAEEALTTNSQVGLRKSTWEDVEAWDASDIDGIPLGVAPVNVADNEYFWLQVHGEACVLYDSDDNSTLGRPVIPSVSVDGAVRGYDTSATTTVQINQIVGHAMVTSVDTESTPVFLTIE